MLKTNPYQKKEGQYPIFYFKQNSSIKGCPNHMLYEFSVQQPTLLAPSQTTATPQKHTSPCQSNSADENIKRQESTVNYKPLFEPKPATLQQATTRIVIKYPKSDNSHFKPEPSDNTEAYDDTASYLRNAW